MLERNGDLSTIDLRTGALSLVGDTGLVADSLDTARREGVLFTMEGHRLYAIDPATARAELVVEVAGLEGADVCAIAGVAAENVLLVERTTGRLFTFEGRTGEGLATVGDDPLPGPPCGLAIVGK